MDAEDIVRALAAASPIVDDGGFDCTLCDAPGSLSMFSLPEAHRVDCPWRQAYEWCEARGIADPSESRARARDVARALAGYDEAGINPLPPSILLRERPSAPSGGKPE